MLLSSIRKYWRTFVRNFLLIILILIRIASKELLDRATTLDYRELNYSQQKKAFFIMAAWFLIKICSFVDY